MTLHPPPWMEGQDKNRKWMLFTKETDPAAIVDISKSVGTSGFLIITRVIYKQTGLVLIPIDSSFNVLSKVF